MTPGPNCYSFLEGGVWIDPLFPNPMGMWEALPDGVITQYTAWAVFEIPGVVTFLLVQNGKVTPDFSKGQIRLKAVSTVYLGDEEGPVLAKFVSTGYEVDTCP